MVREVGKRGGEGERGASNFLFFCLFVIVVFNIVNRRSGGERQASQVTKQLRGGW